MAIDRVAAESDFGIHLRQIGSGADLRLVRSPGTVLQSTMFSGLNSTALPLQFPLNQELSVYSKIW